VAAMSPLMSSFQRTKQRHCRVSIQRRAMLADATAVMNREFEQKFWVERAAKGWSVPAPHSQPPAVPEIKEEERRQ